MATLNTSDAGSWANWVSDFDRVSQLFNSNFSTLQQLAPYVRTQNAVVQARYNELIAKGAQHQASIAQLRRTRDTVASWLRSVGQAVASGVGVGFEWLKDRFGLSGARQGLGAVPIVIGVAGVAAAGVLLYNAARWINDSLRFQQEMNAMYRLQESGATVAEAQAAVSQTRVGTSSQPLLQSITGNIPWPLILAGVAIVFLGPSLLKMVEDRR